MRTFKNLFYRLLVLSIVGICLYTWMIGIKVTQRGGIQNQEQWISKNIILEYQNIEHTAKRVKDSGSIERYNEDRVRWLRQNCQQYQKRHGLMKITNRMLNLKHILVNDDYKMMFCYIPKIACSKWKKLMLLLTGNISEASITNDKLHQLAKANVSSLNSYSNESKQHITQNYKRYVVVRHPFERLLSAYRNKFAAKNRQDYFVRTAKAIAKTYRGVKQPTLDTNFSEYNVSFLEFVKYLTDDRTKTYNEHWEKFTSLCHPCLIQYDFIGKYETIHQDADFILDDIGAPSHINFHKKEIHGKETKDVVDDFYSTIPTKYLAKLYEIFIDDFDLFGYPMPERLKLMNTTV